MYNELENIIRELNPSCRVGEYRDRIIGLFEEKIQDKKERFILSDKEFDRIIDSLDSTGGYLIKEWELRHWIEYYVNNFRT